MRATFQEEEKELFETYLDTYVFPTQSTLPNKIIIGSPIELIIKPQCNQKCEYCYIYKHGDDLYPVEERISDDEILNHLDSFLDYVFNKRQVFIKDWELFAGDIYGNGLIYKILDIFYKYLKIQYEKHRSWYQNDHIVISMPCNFYYLATRPEDVQKTIDYQYKLSNIGVAFCLSCSTDGKYAVDIREKKDLSDEYFDQLMKAGLATRAGFHPMVSYESIDSAIENYDWWLEQFKKYFPDAPEKPFSPMFLEVRNDGWTDEAIEKYLNLLHHVIEVRYKACHESVDELAKNLFGPHEKSEPIGCRVDSYDLIKLNLVSFSQQERVSCGLQSFLIINLADLSIVPCHRLSYPQFKGAKFIQNDNQEIVGIKPLNVSGYLMLKFFKTQTLPKCQVCPYKAFCLKGCYGSQFESRGDPFIPIPSVCKLLQSKYYYLISTYAEMGVLQSAIKNKYLTDEESIRALKQICSKMGYVIDEE